MVKHIDKPSTHNQEHVNLMNDLILFNDDVHTFDFVIECLVEICQHEPEQAEQCALITHFKGKCNIKRGDFYELKPLQEEMHLRGLTVSIE
ncbi:MAG: ATP-dependent Clp protease adaptor ClpS [Bacteroidales bacterium]|nr:ATP-dependent Clp protease adaptor ClpS [Bacteroidales bacterium]MDD4603216.1 ATP-dependent Clp protease adaptor ClpS [Bacteroidales bacterium]